MMLEESVEGYNISVDVNYYQKFGDYNSFDNNYEISPEVDTLYKEQFLEAMNEKIYDEEMIQFKLDYLYDIFRKTKLNEIMNKLCKRSVSYQMSDNKIGFLLLFSFDFYYITHSIICHYFVFHEIHEELFSLLNEKIDNINILK